MKLFLLFSVLCLSRTSLGLNILVLTPFGSNSVRTIFWTLTKSLLDHKHSVSLITSGPPKITHANLSHIQAPHASLDQMDMFEIRAGSDYVALWAKTFPKIATEMYLTPQVMELWQKRTEFDLIIVNGAANEMALPFLINVTAPYLTVAPAGIEPIQLSFLGNIVSPAALPFISLPYNDHMSLKERAKNTLLTVLYRYGYHKKVGKPLYEALLKIFPEMEEPWEYYLRQAGTLINRHHVLDGAIPLLPNQVEIGCITCKPPQKLPQDLDDWVSGSGKNGTIYFSLGSWQSYKMPRHYLDTVLEAFRSIPQRVVMVGPTDLEVPSNVKAWKWLPQQDLLGHPSVVAFISHCGLNSASEAMYHGVPMIGLPITFDQPRVCARKAYRGEAIVLSWTDITSDIIVEAILNITNNSQYKNRANATSTQFRAQTQSSLDKIVWWVEHIHEFGKGNFKFSGADLKLSEYLLLDVLLLYAAILIPLLLILVLGLRQLFTKIWGHLHSKLIIGGVLPNNKDKLKTM